MSRKNMAWIVTLGIVATAVTVVAVFAKRSKDRKSFDSPYGNDPVDLYVAESFPASDAPGYSPTSRIGRHG